MQTYSFCQVTYPAKMISLQGDTIVAITVPQLKVINRTINGYQNLKELNEVLVTDIMLSNGIITKLEDVVTQKDSIIFLTEQKFRLSEGYIKHMESVMENDRKKHRKRMFQVGLVSVSVGAIIGILVN